MIQNRLSRFKDETFFKLFLILFWSKDIICSYAKAALSRIPIVREVDDLVLPFLFAMCILFSLYYFFKRVRAIDFAVVGLVIAVYLANIVLFPQNSEYLLEKSGMFLGMVLPLYFVGLCFDAERDFRTLYLTSLVNLVFFAGYSLLVSDTMSDVQAQYSGAMHRAYYLLPQLLVITVQFLKKPNAWNLSGFVLGFFLLLLCGNRGSIILLVLFVVVHLLFFLAPKYRVAVYTSIGVGASLLVLFYEKIYEALSVVVLRLGMSSRVLQFLSDGEFFTSKGRNAITSRLFEALSENPLIGYGIAGDRAFVGSYAHNLAVELWVSFGVIVGTIILAVIFVLLVRGFLCSETQTEKAVLLLLVCVGFLKLFISSSYLLEGLFFMLLGVCVKQIRQRRGVIEARR